MPPADDIFPFLIGALVMMIPIVAILTRHQQKMARIMRGMPEEEPAHVRIATAALSGNQDSQVAPQMEQLRNEMVQLRQMVAQQTIALDNLAASQAELARALRETSDVRQRLEQ